MFEGFKRIDRDTGDCVIHAVVGGSGPPLLLLHGYPQTHAMWHRVAPALSRKFTLVAADLRGYGRSSKPPTDDQHAPYSKRAMGNDMIRLMAELGYRQFSIGAHDRGGRVAHRMAIDHPDAITQLSVLDIAPTREMYANTSEGFARAYWHWFYLIQKAPMPERMIGADPEAFWREKCATGPAGLSVFSPAALRDYLSAFADPQTIHASCEDYRAAATIDLQHDNSDGERKVTCPLLALWGREGAIEAHFDCLALWRQRALDVRGEAVPGGHYLAEETPQVIVDHWLEFFT